MTPAYADRWLTVYGGDCREVLAELPAESIDCVVTSPPYWGLRDYGTASWQGGDPEHEHIGSVQRTPPPGTPKQASKRGSTNVRSGDCACGAIRVDRQLGLEETPEEYVTHMVEVFREIRRVLKPSGTAWLNLGDSYATGGGRVGEAPGGGKQGEAWRVRGLMTTPNRMPISGLKPKDLVGIPWRVAFALQADGWWLRRDVIWSKPNPMPESVTDRPTSSHEYLFLLTKAEAYYFDGEAIAEPAIRADEIRWDPGTNGVSGGRSHAGTGVSTRRFRAGGGQPNGRSGVLPPPQPEDGGLRVTRNARSVWTIATRPYPGAHFAVFPPDLPERCIAAGTSERGVCPECGAPWQRTVIRESSWAARRAAGAEMRGNRHSGQNGSHAPGVTHDLDAVQREQMGWRPGCGCGWGGNPDDLDLIASPVRRGADDDRAYRTTTGRRGLDRVRLDGEGQWILTRHEQRELARQLLAWDQERRSEAIAELGAYLGEDELEPGEAAVDAPGATAFAHYIRTDRSGARVPPLELALAWLARGWISAPEPPDTSGAPEPVPATVLDPFGGSGTVGMVAQRLRRRAVLIDLNPAYLEQQLERASREWGVGGRRLRDKPTAPPPDSLWALAEEISA